MARKKQKLSIFSVLITLVLIGLFYFYPDETNKLIDQVIEAKKENNTLILNQKESSSFSVYMCPQDDCNSVISNTIFRSRESLYCAFYELDNEELTNIIVEREKDGVKTKIVVDDRYLDEESIKILEDNEIEVFSDVKRGTRYNNYMHHKFCVIDNRTILTGSMNPTQNGLFFNNNNLLVFDSPSLAKNYLNEFEQLSSNVFGTKKEPKLEFNEVVLEYDNDSLVMSTFFCPQDDCDSNMIKELSKAKKEILFASFVITQDEVENLLLEKFDSGVFVEGVVENRNKRTKGSRVLELNETFRIHIDKNPKTMHHKFFVIDEEVVLTGSMNPSKAGTLYNDENLIIIRSPKIAKLYKDEFNSLIE